jgi:hypothetical protein
MLRSPLRLIVCATAATALIAACGGGGGGSADVVATPTAAPPGATALQVSGTVTGFGSIIIDGQKFDDRSASVSIATNPVAPTGGTLSDVKLGMHVEATSTGGVLGNVVIQAALEGAVGAVNAAAGTFTVYQQTVSVVTTGATPTVFDGVSGLAALTAGDVVEVHGTVNASQQIVATRIERKPRNDTSAGVHLAGTVSVLDTTAKSFKLGDLAVNYAAATVLPAGKALAAGQKVSVYADSAPAGGVLAARGVKIESVDEGSNTALGGGITAYTSISSFTVGATQVDASRATFDGGSAADLAVGVQVAVEGKVNAGVLVATKVRVLMTPADVSASLAGPITDFVNYASFKVRGTPVDASSASYSGGTASDLGNGANVKVTGKVKGEMLKADTVEFTAPPATGPVTLKGEIRDLDAKAGTFHFLGVNLVLAANVAYSGGTAADLANGRRVEVTGTASTVPAPLGATPTLVVTKLGFLGELTPQVSVVSGRVDALANGSFKLPGVTVSIANATTFSGGVLADLANGVEVLVTGTWNVQLQALVAATIEIRKAADKPAGVTLAGAVSDFVSVSSFRIGQQKVDASAAVFADGTAADLANGRAVEASGTLAGPEGGRYVMLAKLRFLK